MAGKVQSKKRVFEGSQSNSALVSDGMGLSYAVQVVAGWWARRSTFHSGRFLKISQKLPSNSWPPVTTSTWTAGAAFAAFIEAATLMKPRRLTR